DFGDSLSIDNQLKKLYGEVNDALKRIDSGTYGKCANCHELIDKARLEAFPAAASCLNCSVAEK
ncbi:MAG: TraR/DksA C4-type zinc finger protein, partial [Patescibacteria group bacterium]|nr:TraR/DksA C4-type zinc finger protein [Patescibacteria group bacterium]